MIKLERTKWPLTVKLISVPNDFIPQHARVDRALKKARIVEVVLKGESLNGFCWSGPSHKETKVVWKRLETNSPNVVIRPSPKGALLMGAGQRNWNNCSNGQRLSHPTLLWGWAINLMIDFEW